MIEFLSRLQRDRRLTEGPGFAERPGTYLTRYAILSDDVVIADQEVAKVYESALATMGVTISYQKSLMSLSGSAEFAKRSRISGLSKDVSPISIRNKMNSHHFFGLMAVQMKYPCQRFSTLARGGGAGFRQLARLDHYRNLHFERTMYNRFRLPFELRLGRG